MVSFHDPLTNSEADSRTGVFVSCMQTLEQAKNSLLIFWFDSNAVVAHREYPLAALALRANVYDGTPVGTTVFDGIPDQILK
jgi:hypothetical protein